MMTDELRRNEMCDTERFWMIRLIEDYLDRKGELMHPKDRSILATLLGKLAISEKAFKVKIEIERL